MKGSEQKKMKKLLVWLQNIMQQANPIDQLSRFLLQAGAVIGIIGILLRHNLILWLGFGLIIWMYVRTFSRDKAKFYKQNQQYLAQKARVTGFFNLNKQKIDKKKKRAEQKKTHRFYNCPECKQQVRIPKGRGKVTITCPSCGTKFVKKS